MIRRILFALSFLLFLNGYAFIRICDRTPWVAQHLGFSLGIAVLFYALQIAAPFLDRLLFPRLREKYDVENLTQGFNWLSYAALGTLSCLVTYLLLADIITTIWALIALPDDLALFHQRTMLVVGALTIGSVALGITQAAIGPSIVTQHVLLPNLPKSFDGFRIAQISDLHVSATIRQRYVEDVVAKTNGLNADLIALTGDMVDGSVHDLRDDVAPLAQLKATHGSFFVTGNHEYYSGVHQWLAEFSRIGIQPLVNAHVSIRRDEQQITLAGITDFSAGHMIPEHKPDAQKALLHTPARSTKILLAHQPASYAMAAEAGVDLMLSGHTHAGQFFPFSMFIGLFQRYYKGLNQHGDLQIYVNKGTGYWGPPLRTGVPPEITLLILRSPQN